MKEGIWLKIVALIQKSFLAKTVAVMLAAGVGVASLAVLGTQNRNGESRKGGKAAAGQVATMAVKWPESFSEDQGYEEPVFKDSAERTNHAFNVADFGKQGSGGWFYRYGSSSKPARSRQIEQNDGERYFQPGVEGLEFKKDFVHTGNGVAAILEWRAAKKGKVDIRVTYVKGVNGDKNPAFPDGVCLYIYKGEELLETRQVEISTERENLMETEISALALEKQESIFIAVDPRNNNAFDGGALYASIRPAGEETLGEPEDAFRKDNNASNQEDFGKQGSNGWYYMYGKGAADCEQVSDWNEDGYINATSPGLVIKKDFIHPGANDAAVLQWIPARDGVIEIRGKYTKFEQKDGNPDWPDGVIIRGYLNEKLLFEKKVEAPREGENSITFREPGLLVSEKDKLYFMVDAGGNYSYDGGVFDISIMDRNGMAGEDGIAVRDDSSRQNIADVRDDFGSQGSNGWFYQEGYQDEPFGAYNIMDYVENDKYADPDYLEIKRDYVNTGSKGKSAVIKWRAAQNGQIGIRASYTKLKNEDANPSWPDGTRVTIYHNHRKLTSQEFAADTLKEVTKDLSVNRVEVKRGDYISMVVNGKENNAYDGGKYEFAIDSLSGLVGTTEDDIVIKDDEKRANNADVSKDFGAQGTNGWFYQYSYHTDPFMAVNAENYLHEDKYYTEDGIEIKRDYIMPSTKGKCAAVKWKVAQDGKVNIYADYTKLKNEDANPSWPDGTVVTLLHNSRVLKTENFAPVVGGEIKKELNVGNLAVKKGDFITLIVDGKENTAYDGGLYSFEIEDARIVTSKKKNDSGKNLANLALDFGKQGSNGWYYLEGRSLESAGLLTKKTEDGNGYASESDMDLQVKKDFVQPGAKKDAMYQWVAAVDGSVEVTGSYVKFGHNDANPDWPDGTKIKVYLNKNLIFEKKASVSRGEGNDNELLLDIGKRKVKKGDIFTFAVDADSNNAWDGGRLAVQIKPAGKALVFKAAPDNDANLYEDFGGQGHEGWYYGYGTGGNDFHPADLNGEEYGSVLQNGLVLKKDGVHPSEKAGAVYRWIAGKNGTVNLEGNYYKFRNEDEKNDSADGVNVSVFQNGKRIKGMSYDVSISKKKDIICGIEKTNLEVKKNDRIDFIITARKNTAWDYGRLDMDILSVKRPDYGSVSKERTNKTNLAESFGEQGNDGWFYLEGRTPGGASLLKKTKDGDGFCSRKEADLQVKKDFVQPGALRHAMYQWVAAKDGSVDIIGSYVKFGQNDANPDWPDGTRVLVYLNKKVIFEKKVKVSYGDGNNHEIQIELEKRKIKAGDVLTFAVGAETNNAWDGGKLAVQVKPTEKALTFKKAPDNDANLYDDFGGQGHEGWYYGYGKGSSDFHPADLNATGDEYGSVLQNGLILKKDGVHPAGKAGAIYRWIAGENGMVNLEGTYHKSRNEDSEDDSPDGVNVSVFRNGELIEGMSYDIPVSADEEITRRIDKLNLEVREDDRLDFIITANENTAWDYGRLNMDILSVTKPDYSSVSKERTNKTNLAESFGEQGNDGWFYLEGRTPEGASLLTKKTDDGAGFCSRKESDLQIKKDFAQPGVRRDAMYQWVAAEDGVVDIIGSYVKFGHQDVNPSWPDGTRVTVYQNDEVLFEESIEALQGDGNDNDIQINIEGREINAGDIFTFSINAVDNNAWDGGRLAVQVRPSESDIVFKAAPDNDANLYDDFGEQGHEGWYYGFGSGTGDFHPADRNAAGDEYGSVLQTGLILKKDGVHPAGRAGAIYRWIAGEDGLVDLDGTYCKSKNEDETDDSPDGVNVSVFLNGKLIEGMSYDVPVSRDEEIIRRIDKADLKVRKNDRLDFMITACGNTAWDYGRLDMDILSVTKPDYQSVEKGRTNKTNLADSFGEQGNDGWFYLEGSSLAGASLLTKKTEDGAGFCSRKESDLQVKKDFVQPGAKRAAMYQWVAAKTGTVDIIGKYVKFGHNDANPDWPDGTRVVVYRGSEVLFDGSIEALQGDGNSNEMRINLEGQEIKAGDILTFTVNAGANNAWDGGKLAVQITPTKKGVVFEAAPDNDANLCEDFGEQGHEGWYYGYGTKSSDFQLADLNAKGDEYGAVLQDGLILKKDGVHPAKEADAIYRWIVGENGIINLEGTYFKAKNEDKTDDSPDGVNVSVFLNGELIEGMSYDVPVSREEEITRKIEKLNLQVWEKDRIDFVITPRGNTAWDYGRLDMDILSVTKPDYSSVLGARTNHTNLADSFGEQGNDGWFYLEGSSLAGASLLTKKTEDGAGFCSRKESDLQVKKDFVQPGAKRAAMYQWVAAKTGTVDIIGKYVKFGHNDANPDWPDGTRVTVYYGNEVIFDKKAGVLQGDGNDIVIPLALEGKEIKAGEILTFVIGANENAAWDGGRLAVQIKPSDQDLSFEAAPDNDANLYNDFGGQGHEGWYYGYGTRSGNFHTADLNANLDEYNSLLHDGLLLKKDGVHPAKGAGAIYRWVAGENGIINLEGNYCKSRNENADDHWPDGVNVSVFLNGTLLEGMSYDVPDALEDKTYKINKMNLTVRKNDWIDFIITAHENTSWDYGRLEMDISSVTKPDYDSVSGERTNHTNLADCFGEQGSDGWFYLEGSSLEGASLLTVKTEDGAGYCSRKGDGPQLKKDFVEPGAKRAAMYQWVAAKTGTVDIIGKYVKFGHNDANPDWPDGTRVIVYHGNKKLLDEPVEVKQGDGNDTELRINLKNEEIETGDILTFVIGANENAAWDGGRLSVQIDPCEEIDYKADTDNAADLEKDFGEQGSDGWYYGYGSSDDFKLADLSEGEYKNSLYAQLLLKKDGVQPDAGAAAIYRWIAGKDGKIDLNGTYYKSRNENQEDDAPDGVVVEVFRNGEKIEGMSYQVPVRETEEISQTIKKTGLDVNEGDKIDFIISAGKNNGWDYGKLEMKIKDADAASTSGTEPSGDGDSSGTGEPSGNGGDDPQTGDEGPESRTNKANLADDFSGTQGQNGWKYGVCNWEGKNFAEISKFENEGYHSDGGIELKKDFVHPGPDGDRSAAYRWIVAKDGKINIKATYVKYSNSTDSNADGVSLRVCYNDEVIEYRGEADGIRGNNIGEDKTVTIERELEVKQNDRITFVVTPENNNSYDGGKIAVEITPVEEP